jgi:hypothetical protein
LTATKIPARINTQEREKNMLRIVTENEIVAAIFEMMPDDTNYVISPSGGGGFFVRINNFPENVLLRSADTFYQKLNDYCVRVENPSLVED